MNATTEINEAINEAIVSCSAHELANELAEHEVSATRSGNYGADDEACEIAGYGTLWFRDIEQNPGWVVRADDCDYPWADDELADELTEIVEAARWEREREKEQCRS